MSSLIYYQIIIILVTIQVKIFMNLSFEVDLRKKAMISDNQLTIMCNMSR
jgi:hypothetical protein